MSPVTRKTANQSEIAGIQWLLLVVSGIVTLSPSVSFGQQLTGSRWSTENPPTPGLVDPQAAQVDEGLRRLPPVEDEEQVKPTASVFSSNESGASKPGIAVQPQNQGEPPHESGLMDWDNPSVVIGPDQTTRMVSHEQLVAQQERHLKGSRYSNMTEQIAASEPQPQANSRFTMPAFDEPLETKKPEPCQGSEGVFARVFDEEASAGRSLSQPGVATTTKDGLSPIFACRLLGLPATKVEEESMR